MSVGIVRIIFFIHEENTYDPLTAPQQAKQEGGDVGHMGGLLNPRPWRGRYRAGSYNTGEPPLPRKRAPTAATTTKKTHSYTWRRGEREREREMKVASRALLIFLSPVKAN